MEPGTKRALIYVAGAIALVATFGILYSIGSIGIPVDADIKLSSTTVEGEVVAVEDRSDPPRKEAIVKLTSGETVRAYVPPSCLVFPGQRASLSRMKTSVGGGEFYVFKG